MLQPVIQEQTSGCGIASSAVLLGLSYAQMKAIANAMGIFAEDTALWSDTQYVRRLLATGNLVVSATSPGKRCRTWPCWRSSTTGRATARSGTGWCLSALMGLCGCWIQPAICRPMCAPTLLPCSPPGLSR